MKIRIEDGVARITMSGRFDFELQHAFTEACAPLLLARDLRAIEVELGGVDHLDSSALGMLVRLKVRAIGANKSVTLLNPSCIASHVLEIANFNHLFTIRSQPQEPSFALPR